MRTNKVTILGIVLIGMIILVLIFSNKGTLFQQKKAYTSSASTQDQVKKVKKSSENQDSLDSSTLTSSGSIIQTKNIGIQVGKFAPDFTLKTIKGKTVHLSDYRGKKVILNFWATWCPPCKKEMPDMEQFYKTVNHDKIEILAVNLTSAEKQVGNVREFIKAHQITFPVLLATNERVPDQYQAFTIPTSYIIDTRGVIRHRIIGPMNTNLMKKQMSQIN